MTFEDYGVKPPVCGLSFEEPVSKIGGVLSI